MNKLKIALQKSGRLSEKSINILEECGIKFPNGGGKLIAESPNFPIEILFLRDDDIPQYVEQGVADVGILGENVFIESRKNIGADFFAWRRSQYRKPQRRNPNGPGLGYGRSKINRSLPPSFGLRKFGSPQPRNDFKS